jgi:hypothetical protein
MRDGSADDAVREWLPPADLLERHDPSFASTEPRGKVYADCRY